MHVLYQSTPVLGTSACCISPSQSCLTMELYHRVERSLKILALLILHFLMDSSLLRVYVSASKLCLSYLMCKIGEL